MNISRHWVTYRHQIYLFLILIILKKILSFLKSIHFSEITEYFNMRQVEYLAIHDGSWESRETCVEVVRQNQCD